MKAAAKKKIKGAGSFPTNEKSKIYFTEVKAIKRSSGFRPDLPEESDGALSPRRQMLLDLQLTQKKKNPVNTTEQNLLGLDNLVENVTNIIPRSRLDRQRTERVCVGNVPVNAPYDCRGHLNEKQGIQEQCLGEIQGTTSQDSSEVSIEEILSEGGDAEHVIPRESQQTGPNMMAQETRDVNTAQESRDEVELGTAGENQTETEEENNP